jgi:tRNA A-37 threonylcarbamoyl transferase component Bud32
MDLQGRTLDGRYQLRSLLGVGGMARVYLATDRVLQRQVAVKVLSPPDAQDPAVVERFRREARAAARLSHPNVVAVFDSGSDAGQHYLVMEYVAGESLAELLARQGSLAPQRAVELAIQVCAALAAAHAKGLVHRDVKPANVLLDGDGRVKVTDFGIAKATAADTLTGSGVVLGTAAYLAPEQAQGGPVDARSDLYALGCVLYELLTGAPPFGSGPDGPQVAVAIRHVSEPPEPPSARNPQVGRGLDAVVLTALAKQPDQRYQRATDMQEALGRVLAGDATAGLDGLGAAGAPTEPLPGLPAGAGAASTGVVAARAVRAAVQRPGWRRWALLVAGLAIAVGLVVALRWPDGAGTRAERAGPTTAPAATSAPSTTQPPPATTAAPSQPGVPGALANLTRVVTAARQQGTADHEAEDLLHQADDLARAVQERQQEGKGKEEVQKKLAELQRKVDELVGEGKLRPPATTQVRQAVAELAQAVQRQG